MYISHMRELVICSGGKPECIAKVQNLYSKGKISYRMSIYSIRVIMEFGIMEKFAIQLLRGEVKL